MGCYGLFWSGILLIMLCYALFCLLWSVMGRNGLLWSVMVCYGCVIGMLWAVVVCFGLFVMDCYGLLWAVMICYGLLWSVMVCSALFCYGLFWSVLVCYDL